MCQIRDVAGGYFLGHPRSPGRQQTPGGQLPAVALTPPPTRGMAASTLQLTPASQQGSSGPAHYLGDQSMSASGVGAQGSARVNTSAGMHTHLSRSKRVGRKGDDTTTALANVLSVMR